MIIRIIYFLCIYFTVYNTFLPLLSELLFTIAPWNSHIGIIAHILKVIKSKGKEITLFIRATQWGSAIAVTQQVFWL